MKASRKIEKVTPVIEEADHNVMAVLIRQERSTLHPKAIISYNLNRFLNQDREFTMLVLAKAQGKILAKNS